MESDVTEIMIVDVADSTRTAFPMDEPTLDVRISLGEESMIAIATITTPDGQTVIPREVRTALKVRAGDLLAWELTENGDEVRVRRVQPLDLEYLHAVESSLSEWNSPKDEEAYRDL